MNFVAHVEVANRVVPTGGTSGPGLQPTMVGAALPDMAAIGGFRLRPRGTEGALGEGVRLHHRTDEVFHADERFRELMGRLRSSLTAAGFGRGPARACGHLGVELLLDGRLQDDRKVVDRVDALLWSVGNPTADVVDAVPEAEQTSWADHLALVSERIAPESYRVVPLVAARLHRILARRPRLAFDEADVPVLSDELRRIQADVDEVANDLVTDTAVAVG